MGKQPWGSMTTKGSAVQFPCSKIYTNIDNTNFLHRLEADTQLSPRPHPRQGFNLRFLAPPPPLPQLLWVDEHPQGTRNCRSAASTRALCSMHSAHGPGVAVGKEGRSCLKGKKTQGGERQQVTQPESERNLRR